jgi:glutamate-1-semialdehyde 2,1-aminomutase
MNKPQLRKISNFTASDEYRLRVHDLIPGGAHTYSKGDDQFPQLAPAAIKHGKGAHVWDLDENMFLDCSMGLTSVVLGHAYEPVIKRVQEELYRGVNFQRPSWLEKEAAERFLKVLPIHQMIKFGKNGSTVTTAAVKIARGYTKRRLVAFPGDHPFYSYDDWFIGKTPASLGIPEEIVNLSVTYKADDLDSLRQLFKKYPGQIACVISEPEKNYGITREYLAAAIDVTHENGALYITDEMITGFKTSYPGTIAKYNVAPDMATWGKGIANGFSFCALTGKKEIMELGGIRREGEEKLFLISTTHGGETTAIAAALATMDEFERNDVIGHNHGIGRMLIDACRQAITEKGVSGFVEVVDCVWQPLFIFRDAKKEIDSGMRTLMLQEMIRNGVLFQGIFSPCYSHTESDVEYFAEAFRQSLDVYGKAIQDGYQKHLVGKPTKAVFRKYI